VLFPSISFLFYFLPVFFAGYCLVPGTSAKNVLLLLASLVFYAWGEPRFVVVLIGLIALNYCAALVIGANNGARRAQATGRDGPTVVVIGDSFTREFWNDYFSLHVGKYVWIHHEECGFFVSVTEALTSGHRDLGAGGTADVLRRQWISGLAARVEFILPACGLAGRLVGERAGF